MRRETLQEHIGRDLEKDVWNEEYREGDIGFVVLELQILLEAQRQSIGNVDSVQERRNIEHE